MLARKLERKGGRQELVAKSSEVRRLDTGGGAASGEN